MNLWNTKTKIIQQYENHNASNGQENNTNRSKNIIFFMQKICFSCEFGVKVKCGHFFLTSAAGLTMMHDVKYTSYTEVNCSFTVRRENNTFN